MGLFFYREVSSPIVTDGLFFNLDAGNLASYPGTGTTWYDLSGNGRNASLSGPIIYNTSSGGELVFNGNNTSVLTNYNTNFTTNFTVNSWFKTSLLQGGRFLISKNSYFANSTTDFPFSIETLGSPTNAIAVNLSIGNDFLNDSRVSSSINTDTWYNLSTTYNQSIFCLYLNGQLVSSQNTSITLSSNSQYWTIGKAAQEVVVSPGSTYFSGSISNISIYNRSLTQQEVAQNFNALKNRYGL
jgi:hypothetical protein